jgi:hypothetical protein
VLKVSLAEAEVVAGERGADLVALDEAFTRLAEIDARKSRVVELRFFGGLDVDETCRDAEGVATDRYAGVEPRPGVALPGAELERAR